MFIFSSLPIDIFAIGSCQTNTGNLIQRRPYSSYTLYSTRQARGTYICFNQLGRHWFKWYLVACSVPCHYMNIWLPLRNTPQRNFNWNSNIPIQENAFWNVACKMAAILSQPQYVNILEPTQWCSTEWIYTSNPRLHLHLCIISMS